MDYSKSYNTFFEKLKNVSTSVGNIFSKAVGGDFEAMGYMQMQLLKQAGLRNDQHVVDVGCGSGRLAYQLSKAKHESYTGFDVVDEFLEHAKEKCSNDRFRFEQISGTSIPLPEQSADFICFFSVFTHLLHEDAFKYLLNAKEVLKPDGKIIFSFLSFDEDSHWTLFDQMVDKEEPTHHNQFVTNSQLVIWAERLGFTVDLLETGSTPFIPIKKKIILENGAKFKDVGSLGQGVCIYSKS